MPISGAWELLIQQFIERNPGYVGRCVAKKHPIINGPTLLISAPTYDFNLDSVLLDVGAGGNKDDSLWSGPNPIGFTTMVEAFPLGSIPFDLPGFAKSRVHKSF